MKHIKLYEDYINIDSAIKFNLKLLENKFNLLLTVFKNDIEYKDAFRNFLEYLSIYIKSINVEDLSNILINIVQKNKDSNNDIKIKNIELLYTKLKTDYTRFLASIVHYNLIMELESFMKFVEIILNKTTDIKELVQKQATEYFEQKDYYDNYINEIESNITSENIYIMLESSFDKLIKSFAYMKYDLQEKITNIYREIFNYNIKLYGNINKHYYNRIKDILDIKYENFSIKQNIEIGVLKDFKVKDNKLIVKLIKSVKSSNVMEINNIVNSNLSYFTHNIPVSLWYFYCYKFKVIQKDFNVLSLSNENIRHLIK